MTHYVFVIDNSYLYKCLAPEQREAEKRASAHYPDAKEVRLVGKSDDPNDRGWSIYERWEKKLAKKTPESPQQTRRIEASFSASKEPTTPPEPPPAPKATMIYTVGKADVYDEALTRDPNLEKSKGGLVWKTRDDARGHLFSTKQEKTFSVYGIEADWEKDTEVVQGSPWRSLTRSAKLVKL